jgi:hypothetical protein
VDQLKAERLSEALGGQAYRTDEDLWVVAIDRSDGRVVVISDRSVEEYADWKAFKAGRCEVAINIY